MSSLNFFHRLLHITPVAITTTAELELVSVVSNFLEIPNISDQNLSKRLSTNDLPSRTDCVTEGFVYYDAVQYSKDVILNGSLIEHEIP